MSTQHVSSTVMDHDTDSENQLVKSSHDYALDWYRVQHIPQVNMKLVPHSQQDMVARHLVVGDHHNIPSHKILNQTWVVSAGLCMAIFKLAVNTPRNGLNELGSRHAHPHEPAHMVLLGTRSWQLSSFAMSRNDAYFLLDGTFLEFCAEPMNGHSSMRQNDRQMDKLMQESTRCLCSTLCSLYRTEVIKFAVTPYQSRMLPAFCYDSMIDMFTADFITSLSIADLVGLEREQHNHSTHNMPYYHSSSSSWSGTDLWEAQSARYGSPDSGYESNADFSDVDVTGRDESSRSNASSSRSISRGRTTTNSMFLSRNVENQKESRRRRSCSRSSLLFLRLFNDTLQAPDPEKWKQEAAERQRSRSCRAARRATESSYHTSTYLPSQKDYSPTSYKERARKHSHSRNISPPSRRSASRATSRASPRSSSADSWFSAVFDDTINVWQDLREQDRKFRSNSRRRKGRGMAVIEFDWNEVDDMQRSRSLSR